MPEPIYLDHNATTPILPEVAEAMLACWEKPCLNPASQHAFGRAARRALEGARERLGDLLGAGNDDSIIFTSGGTESNNLAILSLLKQAELRESHRDESHSRTARLVLSAVEHPSTAALGKELERRGHTVDYLPVDPNGVVRADALPPLLQENTKLVSVILGQNETGVLQPVAQIAAICADRGIPLHTDATQVVGKIPLNFRELGAATMTVAAHKFHGPVGIGALVYREGIEIQPQLFGGFQQAGLRPGTEATALAVGMCRALDLAYPGLELTEHASRLRERAARIRDLRDRFERAILAGYPEAVVNGAHAERLPHTSNIAFVGLDRQMLFLALDQAGVACSTGSACASGSSETSPVLIAMGCSEAVLRSSLRFSLGATTTAAEIDQAARRILACCNNLRRRK